MHKSLGIGLFGSHRTGKTETARQVAKKKNIHFIQTSVTQVFKDANLDPAIEYSLETRLDIQNKILDYHENVWKSCDETFITDRTPIDFIAYALSSIRQDELTDDLDVKFQEYIQKCVSLLNDTFYMVIEVLPGIPVVKAEGKASLYKSHIDHLSFLMSGIASQVDFVGHNLQIYHTIIDLNERIEYVSDLIDSHKYDSYIYAYAPKGLV